MLLRQFSGGEDGAVQIYDSLRDIHRPPTSIRRVLAQNFFYDDDNLVERFLAESVEGPASLYIEQIVESPRSPVRQGNIDLLRFLSVQMNRTPQALDTALSWIDKFTGTLFRQIGELNGFSAEDVSGIKLKMNDERALLSRQTVEGALNWPLLEDLSWHVLINRTERLFIISDHPVVHYNWYLRTSNNISYTSITKLGVQIFLPISPTITLALIDKRIYKFGAKGSSYTEIFDTSDIDVLNKLQVRARKAFVVFPVGMSSEYVIQLCRQLPANSLHRSHAWSSNPVQMGEDKLKSTQAVWRTQVSLHEWLTFSKVKRRIAKEELKCCDRKPDVVEAHELFIKLARNRSNAL